MKIANNYQRTVQYLQKIFDELNSEYFDGKLEKPIITIQSTPKAYGHFSVGEIWKTQDANGNVKTRHEINKGAGTLDIPIEEIVATLCHEMVHYYCHVNEIKDTSRNGIYHNSHFRKEAVARGLDIEYDPSIGWSITNPTEELLDFVISRGFGDFLINRTEFTGFQGGAPAGNKSKNGPNLPKKKGNSIKMVCPCCGNIARVTKTTNLICGDCMKNMIAE